VPLQLSTPVKYIKRVGDRIADGLAERGIVTVEDLLYHLPFRYEDRLHPKPLSAYRPGDMASLIGEVRGTVLLRTRSAPIFEMTVGITPPATDLGAPGLDSETWASTDASMAGLLRPPSAVLETVKCLWFHGTYLKDKFRPGQRLALYGKLEGSRSGMALNAPPGATRFKMIQPTFEVLPELDAAGEDAEFTILEMGRIVPVYESLGAKTAWGAKLTSRWTRRILWTIFKDLEEAAAAASSPQKQSVILSEASRGSMREAQSKDLPPSQPPHTSSPLSADDTLPRTLLQRLELPTRFAALRDLHFPAAGTSMDDLQAARTPAHRRLIFEEFFYLELGLELKRRRLRARHGIPFVTNPEVREALKRVLPFKPTAAQKRVLGEIVADMRRSQPMRRLLQGDVGSGKTIVAFQAALVAIENGFQVALMAPTEILATQHFLSARKLLADKLSPRTGRPYRIALLTGSLDLRSKRETRNRIASGQIDLAIGTHALVEEKVDFDNLGLVIVDEQHRFGVQQRFQLMRKQSPSPTTNPPTNPGAPSSTTLGAPSSPTASSSAKVGSQKVGSQKVGSQKEAPHDPSAPSLTQSPRDRSGVAAGTEPDVLVMTATPIPRTLALTVYGDLELSILDELPPGRTPIRTRRVTEPRAAEVWTFLRKQVAEGRQAYIVYPVIEGEKEDQPELDFAAEEDGQQPSGLEGGFSPLSRTNKKTGFSPGAKATPTPRKKTNLRSATDMHAQLQSNELAGLRLGLLHGRMSADDKDVTMARFKRGELDVLVATTVIEVGVDVPNATVMVIDHADRFGLAQLHQLRGRVGRGAAKSFCILLTGEAISPEAELRLDAMVQTQDGFLLAELDLQQRGPGEFFGTKQAGLPDLRVANLARDRDLLELAKREAAAFVDHPDPTIPRPEIDLVWSRLKQQWQRRYALLEA
jgi:ATP-dependent DNA helicase RecG